MVFYLLFQWSGAMKNGSMSYFCKWELDNTFLGTADAWGGFSVNFKYYGSCSNGYGGSSCDSSLQ